MKPTIGRVVIYKTTDEDKKKMEQTPSQNVQDELPATVVAVWSDTCLNLKVDIDGEGQLWKTSVSEGDQQGNWSWPKLEK